MIKERTKGVLTVLLVEDDIDLADTVVRYLELDGICCHHAATGTAGLQLALEGKYQVLLLDINLPRLDGLQICEWLRREGDDTPVLMLTARGELDDKLAGFHVGTDDYLVKPFALEELVVRLKTLSRRRSGQVRKLSCGELVMDLNNKVVSRSGTLLKVTPTGWRLLEVLLRASPDIVSREDLALAIWGDDIPDSNSLKVHLSNLRKSIDGPFSFSLLHTVGRHGFVIREPDQP